MRTLSSFFRASPRRMPAVGAGAGVPQRPRRCGQRVSAARWRSWGQPISSSARCWRPGPTLSGAEVARALEHLQDRLPPFSEAQARAEIEQSLRQAGGGSVLHLRRAAGGRLHRPGASRPDQRQSAVRVAVKILRPACDARISPAIWKPWHCSPASANASRPRRGGCA